MGQITIFTGAAIMVVLGLTTGRQLSPMAAVGLGLMWIGLAHI